MILLLLLLDAIALIGWGWAIFEQRQLRHALAGEEAFADICLRQNDKLELENMELRRQLATQTAKPSDLIRADPECPTVDPGGPF